MSKNFSKISRLILLDWKRNVCEKLVLIFEMIFCILMITVALVGNTSVSRIDREYKKIIGVNLATYFGEYENPTDNDLEKELYNSYEFGSMRQLLYGEMSNWVESVGYNTSMVKHYKPKLSKGNWFTDNTGAYTQVVLGYDYIKDYKVGSIVDCTQVNIKKPNEYSFYNEKLQVVGFLDVGSVAVGADGDVMKLNAIIYEMDNTENYDINASLLFESVTREDMIKKHSLDEDKVKFESMQSHYDSYIMSEGQIISFFKMFAIIGVFVLITSLLSAVIVKRNTSLAKNIVIVKTGTTQGELLTARSVSILIVLLISLLLSIFIAIPLNLWMVKEMNNIAISALDVTLGAGIVLFIYAIFESIDVVMLYKKIKKEKK